MVLFDEVEDKQRYKGARCVAGKGNEYCFEAIAAQTPATALGIGFQTYFFHLVSHKQCSQGVSGFMKKSIYASQI